MDLCSGGELFDRIVAKGQYSEKDAAALIRTMVSVVAHCHSLGVMHRWVGGGGGRGAPAPSGPASLARDGSAELQEACWQRAARPYEFMSKEQGQ